MKVLLQFRFQFRLDHGLGDTVGHRRNPQRSRSTSAFRYFYSLHRRGKVTTRSQSIPQLVKVVLPVLIKLRQRLFIYASCTSITLYPFIRFPNHTFGKRLCFIQNDSSQSLVDHQLKPDSVAPSLQHHYSAFITTTGNSAPVLRLGILTLTGLPPEWLP